MFTGFWWKSRNERDHYKDLDIEGGNIKMYLTEIGWCRMDWINLFLDRDQWRCLVNTVINLRAS
jgi:hypothetical protein